MGAERAYVQSLPDRHTRVMSLPPPALPRNARIVEP